MKYVHQTKQHECNVCKKKFYYHYNLKSHMQGHTNEKDVICHLCGKFFTLAAYHAHLKTGVHGPVQKTGQRKTVKSSNPISRYYCHICVPAKRFAVCSDLTEHRRLDHNDFECPICKGWFSCNESLQNHLKTHSNKERKHKCTVSRIYLFANNRDVNSFFFIQSYVQVPMCEHLILKVRLEISLLMNIELTEFPIIKVICAENIPPLRNLLLVTSVTTNVSNRMSYLAIKNMRIRRTNPINVHIARNHFPR